MAAISHLLRLRQVVVSSARDAGEALTRAIKADGAVKVSQLATALLDSSLARHVEVEAAAPDSAARTSADESASSVTHSRDFSVSPDGKVDSATPLRESLFERGGLRSGNVATLCSSKSFSRTNSSRLDEAEDWFLTDLVSGNEENGRQGWTPRNSRSSSVSSYGGGRRCFGNMVLVSSVESLLSLERDGEVTDGQSSYGSSRDGDESHRTSRSPTLVSELPAALAESAKKEIPEYENDLEQQLQQVGGQLCSELNSNGGDVLYVIKGKPASDAQRFYMIEAGHGWSSYQSLEHLVSFLGETVKVFGADRLRSTKFLLPVDEAEIFLDDLQKMAPYSLKDLVDAAKAAGAPVLCAVAARFFFLQLTEAVVAFGAAAEATAAAGSGVSAAAGAAAAGEAAAAATGAASVYSVCSTAFALTPWALLVGGCVYGVVRGVRKLHNVREKVFLCPTTDSAETDTEIGLPQGTYRDHCVIKWG